MQIDERTSIPLVWALCAMSSIVISVGIGAFWVKSVDDRLTRIEQKLGIPPLESSTYLEEAKAETVIKTKK